MLTFDEKNYISVGNKQLSHAIHKLESIYDYWQDFTALDIANQVKSSCKVPKKCACILLAQVQDDCLNPIPPGSNHNRCLPSVNSAVCVPYSVLFRAASYLHHWYKQYGDSSAKEIVQELLLSQQIPQNCLLIGYDPQQSVEMKKEMEIIEIELSQAVRDRTRPQQNFTAEC